MTTDSPRDRGSYHHGNLREALVAAALTLIAERGLGGFAFADLARAAGVSPAAPYRHFRDRNAVAAEIARRGFDRFTEVLEAASARTTRPIAALEACGRAYLDFARQEPGFYAVMFAPDLPDEPELRQAGDRAFAVLRRAAEAACAQHPGAGRPPPLMVALHIWSMAHGVATLFVAGTARRRLPMAPEALLEAGLLIYLQSLGLSA